MLRCRYSRLYHYNIFKLIFYHAKCHTDNWWCNTVYMNILYTFIMKKNTKNIISRVTNQTLKLRWAKGAHFSCMAIELIMRSTTETHVSWAKSGLGLLSHTEPPEQQRQKKTPLLLNIGLTFLCPLKAPASVSKTSPQPQWRDGITLRSDKYFTRVSFESYRRGPVKSNGAGEQRSTVARRGALSNPAPWLVNGTY